MRIYLASRYSRRDEMLAARNLLQNNGHIITSRWINGDHQISDAGLREDQKEEQRTLFAIEDYEDLRAAECTIIFTEPPRSTSSRGGRHVEFGMALALRQIVVVVGPRENVFHCLPQVIVLPTLQEFLNNINLYMKVAQIYRAQA